MTMRNLFPMGERCCRVLSLASRALDVLAVAGATRAAITIPLAPSSDAMIFGTSAGADTGNASG